MLHVVHEHNTCTVHSARFMEAFADPSSEFSRAVAYAMKSIGAPGLALKQEQQAAIQTVYGGGDVLVWLPTGFGKSICFEVLPFVYNYKLGRAGTRTCSLVFDVAHSYTCAIYIEWGYTSLFHVVLTDN